MNVTNVIRMDKNELNPIRKHLSLCAKDRHDEILKFAVDISKNQGELQKWGISINPKLQQITACSAEPETLLFANNNKIELKDGASGTY